MDKKDIVDLVQSEDGEYGVSTKSIMKYNEPKPKKKKYDRRKADDFLSGLDAGLTFVEEVNPLIDRFLKLRG